MRFVVPTNVPASSPRGPAPRKRGGIGAAITTIFGVIAVGAGACGDAGSPELGQPAAELGQQSSEIRCGRDDCPDPPPHEPCGVEGNQCCVNGRCQTGLLCLDGTCTMCGVPGGPCCAGNACSAGSACANGTCERTCGVGGKPCCSGTTCDSGLVCASGTCTTCGGNGQLCCGNNSCNGNGLFCSSGTCRPCGGNGQTCCPNGSCGGGLYCATGNTCRPTPCGLEGLSCCPGASWQRCPGPPGNLACNEQWNRCERCGGTGQVCCASPNQACTWSDNTCVSLGFRSTCEHCGRTGEPCCTRGTACTNSVCGSNNTCQTCGSRGLACCPGNLCGTGTCTAGFCR